MNRCHTSTYLPFCKANVCLPMFLTVYGSFIPLSHCENDVTVATIGRVKSITSTIFCEPTANWRRTIKLPNILCVIIAEKDCAINRECLYSGVTAQWRRSHRSTSRLASSKPDIRWGSQSVHKQTTGLLGFLLECVWSTCVQKTFTSLSHSVGFNISGFDSILIHNKWNAQSSHFCLDKNSYQNSSKW